jgi:hypothetical protein
MNWVIAIPSYSRPTILQNITLQLLKKNNIPNHLIHIFIVEEQLEQYKSIPTELYGTLVIGEKGIIPQRNFISNYFTEGQYIVSLDDDIKNITFIPDEQIPLVDFFNKAFDTCIKENAFIWGIYPIANLFYLDKNSEYSTHLTFICGAVYGYINRPNNPNLVCNITSKYLGNKEDIERSILYWLNDKKMVRFNRVGILTKFYNPIGGIGSLEQRLPTIIQETISLNNAYPTLTKIKIRKNGLYEIVLKDKSVTGRITKGGKNRQTNI